MWLMSEFWGIYSQISACESLKDLFHEDFAQYIIGCSCIRSRNIFMDYLLSLGQSLEFLAIDAFLDFLVYLFCSLLFWSFALCFAFANPLLTHQEKNVKVSVQNEDANPLIFPIRQPLGDLVLFFTWDVGAAWCWAYIVHVMCLHHHLPFIVVIIISVVVVNSHQFDAACTQANLWRGENCKMLWCASWLTKMTLLCWYWSLVLLISGTYEPPDSWFLPRKRLPCSVLAHIGA